MITLFPGMFLGPSQDGILARARRGSKIGIRLHDLRRWGVGPHRQVDDAPYGGGGGMILRPEPIFDAVAWVRQRHPAACERVVLLSPRGRKLDHDGAKGLAGNDRVILLCGRYEGVDERVRESLADEEVSVGDVVLTGGEIPALLLIDAVSRFVPGVLGRPEAVETDSFSDGKLDFPHYTRPACYRGLEVPEVLLTGNHGAIERWRARMALETTKARRPDLLEKRVRGKGARGAQRGSSWT